MYCPLELNDYNAFPEENMNYPNGFHCPAEIQTDFIDHNSQSTWNTPPNMPTAWGHADLISSQVSAAVLRCGPDAAPGTSRLGLT